MEHSFKIGDILYASWGYDQTNIDYYQVTGVTDKSIRMKGIKSTVKETGFMCGESLPVLNEFTDHVHFKGEKLFRVKQYKSPYEDINREHVRICSYCSAWKWDGNPLRCSWYA